MKFIGRVSDGLEMELKGSNRSTRSLWLAGHEDIPASLLLNASVRATGAYRSVMGLDGQTQHGMISVVNAANLRILNVAAEQWDKTPRTGITNLTGAKQRAETIVAHMRSTVAGLRPDGEFLLDDGTGQIRVRAWTADGLTNGLAVEVLGRLVHSGPGLEVTPAFFRAVESAPSVLPVLTTAAQVKQLSAREAARQHPVHVRGVITCLVGWGRAVGRKTRRAGFSSTSTLRIATVS